MQDYAKLYKWRYSERRSSRLVNRIRRVVYSNLPKSIQLVVIIGLVALYPRR